MLTRDILLSIACLALMLLIPLLIYIFTLIKRELEQDQIDRNRSQCEPWYEQLVDEEEDKHL